MEHEDLHVTEEEESDEDEDDCNCEGEGCDPCCGGGNNVDIKIDFDVSVVNAYQPASETVDGDEDEEDTETPETVPEVAAPTLTHIHLVLTDTTELDDGTTWADLKATAMVDDYKTT